MTPTSDVSTGPRTLYNTHTTFTYYNTNIQLQGAGSPVCAVSRDPPRRGIQKHTEQWLMPTNVHIRCAALATTLALVSVAVRPVAETHYTRPFSGGSAAALLPILGGVLFYVTASDRTPVLVSGAAGAAAVSLPPCNVSLFTSHSIHEVEEVCATRGERRRA